MDFKNIERTGLNETEILRRARQLQRSLNKECGKGAFSLQDCIDSAINAAAEYAQG